MLSMNCQEGAADVPQTLFSLVNLHGISTKLCSEGRQCWATVCGLLSFFLFLPFTQFPNFYSFLTG